MQPGSLEHLTYCAQQEEHCRIATSNESLTVMDRVSAQVGELDWITAAEMEKENSLAELAEDLAAIRESQNKSAEEALSNKQGWNEVCPSCHIHRGHRARMRTLNGAQSAKGKEMHLCPMQYDLANRVIEQMSNPGDTVLDPFAGLMTVPYCAIPLGRKAIGIELNSGYFADGVAYCEMAENQKRAPGLFDLVAEEN